MRSVLAVRALCALIAICALHSAVPASAQTPDSTKTGKVITRGNYLLKFPDYTAKFPDYTAKYPGDTARSPRYTVKFPAYTANFRYFASPAQPADPLADAFFAPELVMRHQQRIGLTGEQRAAIIRAIQEAQPRFVEAQWQLEPETAALSEIVKGTRVDEQRVLQQIDRVLEIERQIKRSQLELLVQIKNQLTEEQQTELARLGGSRALLQGNQAFPPVKR